MLKLRYCCKRLQLLLPICRTVGDSETHLQFFQKEPIFIRSSSSKSSLSVAEKDEVPEKGHSFTNSYLMNSCGLSPKLAVSVSKKVYFDTPERPDSVLNLLKAHGFNDAHITELVKKRPKLLLANAEKTLLPKLEFFGSIGISGADLVQVLCSNPNILTDRSLERTIIPCYDIIKSLLRLDNVKIVQFFRRSQRAFSFKVLSNIAPNMSVLRALQVPEGSMSSWVTHHTFVMSLETEKFKENVKKVVSMGFCPLSATFVKALHVISLTDASKWAQKREFYGKCGWTEDDFLLAFRKNPLFMNLSEKNFSSKMDFLVNKMSCHPADLAANPTVLTLSLEKWIIPRCSVIRILLLKGLMQVKGELSLGAILVNSKGYFLDRFVIKYQEQVPELLSIFEGKMGLVELGLGFEE